MSAREGDASGMRVGGVRLNASRIGCPSEVEGVSGHQEGPFHFGFKAGIDWIAGAKLGRPHLRIFDDL